MPNTGSAPSSQPKQSQQAQVQSQPGTSQPKQGVPPFQNNDYLQAANPAYAQATYNTGAHFGHQQHYGQGQSQPMDYGYLQPSNPEAAHAQNQALPSQERNDGSAPNQFDEEMNDAAGNHGSQQ